MAPEHHVMCNSNIVKFRVGELNCPGIQGTSLCSGDTGLLKLQTLRIPTFEATELPAQQPALSSCWGLLSLCTSQNTLFRSCLFCPGRSLVPVTICCCCFSWSDSVAPYPSCALSSSPGSLPLLPKREFSQTVIWISELPIFIHPSLLWLFSFLRQGLSI